MARKRTSTVRLDGEDAAARARTRAAGIPASDLIRQGLRVVGARFYRKRRPPTTGLFVSTSAKLSDESELFEGIDRALILVP
jgi:hypothetical protein